MLFVAAVLIVFQVGPPAAEFGSSTVQDTDLQGRIGVVWTAPESSLLAIAELESIHSAGIRLVRTGPVSDPTVLGMADSLGLTLYRELPITRYSARQLVDSTAFAGRLLTRLISSGVGHASAGPIGLAVLSDVSDPAACSFFDEMKRRLPTGSTQEIYYVGSFVERDACSGSVDFVLLDGLDHRDPIQILVRWKETHESSAGLGAVGWWVDTNARRGLGIEHSEEEQARALENALGAFEKNPGSQPIFVHRWSDQTQRRGGEVAVWDIYGRHFGLTDASGRPRPAHEVLSAYLTTGQNVFALHAAPSSAFTFPWFILLGWMQILVVAILYASSPRFRYMLPRYFVAHGFFRNAVREAREVLPIVSTALLTVMGIAVGQVGTQVFMAIHDTEPVQHLVASLPYQAQAVIIAMLDGPLLSVFLIGCLSLLAMSGWMGLWMIVASRKAPLLPSQALMLGVWPRWQLLLLLPMAMSIHTLPPDNALAWMWLLIPLWLGTAFWATIRTTFDLFKITQCGRVFAVSVWLLNPIWLGLVALLVITILHGDQTAFLWHLVTRT